MASRRTLKEEFGVKEDKKWGGPAQDVRQMGSEKNDWRGEGDEVMNEGTMMRHWDIRTRGPCGNIVRGTGMRWGWLEIRKWQWIWRKEDTAE